MSLDSLTPTEDCNAYNCPLFSGGNPTVARAATVIPASTIFANLMGPWKRNVLILTTALLFLLFVLLVTHHRGVRRIYQFWSSVAPWILEYKLTKFKYRRLEGLPLDQVQQKLHPFHQRTAHKAVKLVMEMGGIYVKLGQVFSTVGVGILQDDYIQAMRPLQDGIPPKSLDEMSRIFYQSTGRTMEEAFEWIAEEPIGAASIAQAHKAVLKKKHPDDPDDVVIVKIQYPDVAELFGADLNNMEICVRLLIPGSMDMMRAVKERHSRELDFREEAGHLRECADNLIKHGNGIASLVKIPVVRNETGLCTDQVLVMEFLEGQSLHSVIEQEQDRMARALGKADGQALREFVLERIGEHLEQTHANATKTGFDEHPNRLQRIVTIDLGAGIFRFYVRMRDRVRRMKEGVFNILAPSKRGTHERSKQQRPINMGKILKTLIHVHGLQLLRDGVYNADPHPGNVVFMQDGRLGLLDYGMVGRVTTQQRRSMAKTILALAKRDTRAVNEIYREAGYRATWKEGDVYDNPEIVRRFAGFHFDKFDLSPVSLIEPKPKHPAVGGRDVGELSDSSKLTSSSSQLHLSLVKGGRSLKVLDILETTQEWSVPDWIEQGRRLTGLLLGVSLQAGHPTSIAKEWSALAQEVLGEQDDKRADKESY